VVIDITNGYPYLALTQSFELMAVGFLKVLQVDAKKVRRWLRMDTMQRMGCHMPAPDRWVVGWIV
jgi:hypothetical protein